MSKVKTQIAKLLRCLHDNLCEIPQDNGITIAVFIEHGPGNLTTCARACLLLTFSQRSACNFLFLLSFANIPTGSRVRYYFLPEFMFLYQVMSSLYI